MSEQQNTMILTLKVENAKRIVMRNIAFITTKAHS
jgi:hypothetical protein